VITKTSKPHQKHAPLVRPNLGDFGRNELGILGAPCKVIRGLAERWLKLMDRKWKVAYVDADHKEDGNSKDILEGASLQFIDKISHKRIDFKQENITHFSNRILFNDQDLVLINGNHFTAKKQIVIIHPGKPLDEKLDKLTDVALILLSEHTRIPEFMEAHLPDIKNIPVLALQDEARIISFLTRFLNDALAPLNGLVLAGGKSTRMLADKGSIAYHGMTQRAYMFEMLSRFCGHVYLSDNTKTGFETIEDTFTGLGPFGGILSAMQSNPNAAWLTVACDLPYLTADTLDYLVKQRNPSKLATAFLDSDDKFPEPLITIWEPRAYPVMLQFLAQGYSCPRKVLINTDIELLTAPDVSEFRNANSPEERDEALRFFKSENHSF
jgi:molybdopterin-guanine dinucleotide biosynthesis protein A